MKDQLETYPNNTNDKNIEVVVTGRISPVEKSVDYAQKEKESDKKDEEEEVNFFQLFRFASTKDKVYMALGSFMALANGLAFPLFSIVFGDMIDSFGPDQTEDEIVDSAWDTSKWFYIIGSASLVASWIQMFTWIEAGERQANVFRKKYLEALMRQDIAWFDEVNPNTLASKVSQECFSIQGAIGEKVSTFIMTVSMVVGGFAVAFINGWELALICTAFLPFLGISGAIFTNLIQTSDIKIQESYTEANAQTEQTVSGIKTVKSLNGEEHEEKKYMKSLKSAYDTAIKYGFKIGTAIGFLWFTIFADYAIGFWAGSRFIGNETTNAIFDRAYTTGDVIAVFFSIMIGGFSAGQAAPCLKSFGLGKQAAYKVFKIIDAKPKISPSLEKGKVLQSLKGDIELKEVEFTYPTKLDVQVLKKLSLKIQAGKKTALVGESGCGKSTVMQLVERFYDCDKGGLFIDGQDIKDLNLKWLRENIGYVGQEPVLFATTIEQNLKFGKPGASKQEIVAALKQANAYDFVMGLQDKLQTYVGSCGSQLSGGQKQRLCIARAILKNPQILLLDEATSALDRTNERSIQQTLDDISKNRTTIVIAHRLSTVQNSDHIIVIDQGRVVEQGNHNELVQNQGKYFALCQNQLNKEKEEEDQENEQIINDSGLQRNKKPHLKMEEIIANQSVMKNKSKVSQTQEESELQNLTAEEKKALQKEQEIKDKRYMSRLTHLNKPETPFMWLGGIFSLIGGLAFPMTALIMADMIDTLAQFSLPDQDKDEFFKDTNILAMWFLVIAVVSGVASVFQFGAWQRVAEGLTMRIRQECFRKICRMPGAWFDEKENNPGTLASRVGTDTQKVNSLTSTVVNIQIANFSSLISGLIIAFIHDWRSSLVALGLIPFILVAGAIQAQFTQGFSELTDSVYKESGQIVSESVTNMRTVYSFTAESGIKETYRRNLQKPERNIAPNAHKTGLAFGFSQMVMFIIYGIQFYLGAVFVRDYGVQVKDMYTAVFGIMYAAFGAGNNNMFMGDIGKAKQAARSIFALLDSEDEIQIHEKQCQNPIKGGEIQGNIELRNVYFKYPQREKIVLNNVSLKIQQGQKIAFVGPSGCGKSTIMQLLLRFYQPLDGKILLDGNDICQYDIHFLRSQFGVVNQEPILFRGTIKENIEYNTGNITMKDIKMAAQQANAAKFIEENRFEVLNRKDEEGSEGEQQGSGYDRQVGNKGGALSGGQKQRIAIARAIIKKPRILLLDEATSALDAQNEQIVQESLDKIMENKTSLAIAHRISTIKDSNTIYVMEDGNVVEEGGYDKLKENKSYFYRLERGETK